MKLINKLPDNYIEHHYFNRMLKHFDDELFKDRTVIISHNYKQLPEYGKHVVAILTAGDERGNPPVYSDKVGLVFKHHLDKDNIKNNWHIPLTYVNDFKGNYNKPINDRQFDIFFVGRNQKRKDFIQKVESLMKKTKSKYNWYWHITGYKFMEGLPLDEYAELMSNSKIVLSPCGAVRVECLRFTEAVKCGCGIIAPNHPDTKVFRNCPATYISEWDPMTLEGIIDFTLSNIEDIHKKMKVAWDSHFCPEAVAKYINVVVKDKG